MTGKEVRTTTWQDGEGKKYPVVTHRYSRRFLSGEYEVRVVHAPTRPQRSPSHEVAAIGRFPTAEAAEGIAIDILKQREERAKHY